MTAPSPPTDELIVSPKQRAAFVSDALVRYRVLQEAYPGRPISDLLPLIFKLKGKPFAIEEGHFLQEPMYKLTGEVPRRIVFKAGRQVAKCGSINTWVRRTCGESVQLKDVVIGDVLVSMTSDDRAGTGTVSNIWRNGVQKVFEIETRRGSKFRLTGNHKLRTLYGYTKVSDLKVGSRLGSLRRGGTFADKPMPRERIILTAYMIGDGSTSRAVQFSGVTGPVTDEFAALMDDIGDLGAAGPIRWREHLTKVNGTGYGLIRDWFEEDKLWEVKSPSRFLPPWVFQLSKADTCLFMSRLWATDGMIKPYAGGQNISYGTTSRRLARDVQSVLAKLGIMASIDTKEAWFNGVRFNDAYIVRVEGREAWARFHELLQVPGKPPLPLPTTDERSNRDTVPIEINEQLNAVGDRLGRGHTCSFQSAKLRRTAKYPLSRPKLAQYRDHLVKHLPEDPTTKLLGDLIDGDVVWDEVVSIMPFGEEEVLDIEVVGDHNFIIDAGVISHNSTGLAASGILRVATRPYFNHLTVTPLFEQVRKFSGNYVRPFLVESTFKTKLLRPGSDNSVLQRTIANGANLFYNYASNSADRIRGTSADGVDFDEMQDFDLSVIPIIESTMDASKYKLVRYSGTPKTFDGPLEVYWQQSSQAHWHIPCGCGKLNRCSVDGDLLKMVESEVTLVCANPACCKPLDSRLGYYVHDFPERRLIFPGYHLPQPAFPMHYADPSAWFKLRDAIKTKPKYVVYNEIFGESIDVGLKMLTQDELAGASSIVPRKPSEHNPRQYLLSSVGVDWGGKGKELTTDKEEFISNTAVAVAGLRHDGRIEVTNIRRLPYEANHMAEAAWVRNTAVDSGADWLAHDFGGAGDVRETLLIHSPYPSKKIMPCTYSLMSVNKPIVHYNPKGADGVRRSYTLDKTRSLQLLCALIKARWVILPEWTSHRSELSDFFSLFEESIEGPRGSARRLVKKIKGRTDDVVHAINFAVMALYHASRKWPNLAEAYMNIEGEAETWRQSDV